MNPKRGYNPKSAATVKDQGDDVCANCYGFKPCGCDLDNIGNHPQYRVLAFGEKVEEQIDENQLDYDRYVANSNTAGCYVLSREEYDLLRGPLTPESLDLALRLAEANKIFVREAGLIEAMRRTLRRRKYYGIKEQFLPYRENFAVVGRYVNCTVGKQTVAVNVLLDPVDQKIWRELTGVDYQTMSNLAGLREPEPIGITKYEGIH